MDQNNFLISVAGLCRSFRSFLHRHNKDVCQVADVGLSTEQFKPGASTMGILRRTFVMMVAGCILAGGTEAFAKGPRILLNATLSPATGAPASAKGKAKFDQSASRTNFSVEAENLRSLNGKVVSIFVNGTLVGNKTVALGRVKLELTNQRGGSVPAVVKGTVVELKVGSALLMAGAF